MNFKSYAAHGVVYKHVHTALLAVLHSHPVVHSSGM